MSRLCCVDEKKAPEGKKEELWVITDDEIQQVVREATEKQEDKKPSISDLHERIEDLEFELECIRADNEEEKKKKTALRRLVEVIDLERIEPRNQPYLRAIVKKIKQLVS